MAADGARGSSVPSSNRGLKGVGGQAACIDYLTFTAPVSSVPAKPGMKWVECAFAQYLHGTALRLDGAQRGQRNFYEWHWRIVGPEGQVCGFVAVGGNAGTLCFQLMGQGCAYVNDWNRIADELDKSGASITRVDCAHDDFEGTHPVRWAEQRYDAGEFVRGGRPPSAEFIDDKGSNKGCTFYVGRNSGNQTLCVYEKGKQLGDPSSPWVRYEGRFGNKYRSIPSDVLRRPGEFLAGMFPVLGWISAICDKFATAKKKVEAGLNSLAHHLRRQYGRVLNFAKSIQTESEFTDWVTHLCRSGLPDKLKVPHVGVLVSADIWRNELCVS